VTGAKSPIALTILALGAFGILISLGVWQLQRRAWKNDLLARLEYGLSAPPVPYEEPRGSDKAGTNAQEFRRVKVQGRFLNGETLKVLAATPETMRAETADGFGYLFFTPLKFADGIVIVNRGFVPMGLADNLDKNGGNEEQTITGIIRQPQKPGWFMPAAQPEKRLFYSADIPAMAAAATSGKGGIIATEYIEADTAGNEGRWPKGRDPRTLLDSIPNRHLEYALTWFGLAAALAGVSGFYIARN
jgi:surfeit locus 1 family protein